ncbi:MAG: phosphatase PAP2 family protein [Lentisphaeraceae bacterium]|nr:phosphatase PAP2 family protein [Lentisphaeraceae bacterium]
MFKSDSWNLKVLIACNVAGILIFCSWFSSQNLVTMKDGDKAVQYKSENSIWKSLDTTVFSSLNGSLKDNKSAQTFWAIANSRLFDLVSASLMVGIFTLFIFSGTQEEKLYRIKCGFFMTICMIIGMQFFHAAIYNFERLSPTKIPLDGAILLSDFEHITWKIKDSSKKSFPGDHAAVLFMVATFIAYYTRKWHGIAAAVVALLFVLPRMIGGGHWFTDIFIGGGTIALITCSWALCSPAQKKMDSFLNVPVLLVNVYKC